MAAREQVAEERGARAADVEIARGARREAAADAGHEPFPVTTAHQRVNAAMPAFADVQSSSRGLNVLQTAGNEHCPKERNRLIFLGRRQVEIRHARCFETISERALTWKRNRSF